MSEPARTPLVRERVGPRLSVGLANFGDWFASPRALVDAAVALEGAGVDGIVVVDHVVLGPHVDRYPYGRFPTASDGDWHDPFVTLAAVAAVTGSLRLATGIVVAPVRRPVVLAKTVASLDALSGGRIDLGVGVGWQEAEFVAAGLDFAARGSLLDDAIGACRALWAGGPASFTSPSVTFEDTWCRPRPVQERLPVLFSGTLGARNRRRIVSMGDGWIPAPGTDPDDVVAGAAVVRREWDQAGRSGRPRVRAWWPLTRTGSAVDVAASGGAAEALVAGGVTDLLVSAQALATSRDASGLVEVAGGLAAAVRGMDHA